MPAPATRADASVARVTWRTRAMALVAGLWSLVRREIEFSRARRKLEALDDRLLKDMGVPRSEIDHLVRRNDPWLEHRRL